MMNPRTVVFASFALLQFPWSAAGASAPYFGGEVSQSNRWPVAHPQGEHRRINRLAKGLPVRLAPPPANLSEEYLRLWKHSAKYGPSTAVYSLSDSSGHVLSIYFNCGDPPPFSGPVAWLETVGWWYSGDKSGIVNELRSFRHLEHLDLFSLGREVIDTVHLDWPSFKRLQYLGMPVGCVDADLARLHELKALRHLSLQNCGWRFDGSGLSHLSKCKNLRILDLGYCHFIDAANFAALSGIKNLTTLMLSGSEFDEKQLIHLTKCSSLKALTLHQTSVSTGTLAQLVAGSKSLEYVSLMVTAISPDWTPPETSGIFLDFRPLPSQYDFYAPWMVFRAIGGDASSLKSQLRDNAQEPRGKATKENPREMLKWVYLYLHHHPTPESDKKVMEYSHANIKEMKEQYEIELSAEAILEVKNEVKQLLEKHGEKRPFVNQRCKYLPLFEY